MKKILKVLAIFGLAMGLIYIGKQFIQTDNFKVSEVVISGDNLILKKSILDKLKKIKGKNIVYVDTKKIEKIIREDARVKSVTIRKIFPRKLEVNIEERKPYVYVKKGSDILIADEELALFGYMKEEVARNIPIVIYEDEKSLTDLKIIISKIKNKDLYDIISEIRKADKNYELVLVDGIKIITETSVDEKKYDDAYRLYQKEKKENAIQQYIDIRFKYFSVK